MMNAKELIDSFSQFAREKNIDRPTMMRVLEDVIRTLVKKQYGDDENVDVIINIDRGDFEVWRTRTVVEDESEDIWDADKVALTEALKISEDAEVGEEIAEQIMIDDFNRRQVDLFKQTLKQKVRDMEKDMIFNAYKDRVGEIITGEVYQMTFREILLSDPEGNELVMPRQDQIPKDRLRKGDTVRGVISRVDVVNGSPRIIISRTSPMFLERLFQQEVPEVEDNLVGIRKIVREPGERAKVAVESYDDRIDAVGACVGMKGSRIHAIVRELQNENIDVINYTENLDLFIARALAPARVSSIKIDHEGKQASVFMRPDQVSLAIGKQGHNIKLAARLVGMEIEVYRDLDESEAEDDVAIEEFDDEIEAWIIDEFKRIGLDTARRVLATPVEDLVRRTDLEEETILEVTAILRAEFEPKDKDKAEAKAAQAAQAAQADEAGAATEEAPATAGAEASADAGANASADAGSEPAA